MTLAYWCVFVMIVFPYIFTFLAKSQPNYNNHDPRGYLEKVSGWRKRAHYVQLNSFETTPAFAVAVIIAQLTGASQYTINALAMTYVATRICYALCYLADKAIFRSLFWLVGIGCIIALFCITRS